MLNATIYDHIHHVIIKHGMTVVSLLTGHGRPIGLGEAFLKAVESENRDCDRIHVIFGL